MTKEELLPGVIKYFDGDKLAAEVWLDKYAMKNKLGEILESTPDDMHRRLAKEFHRIEKKYVNPIPEEVIYNLLKDFKYIVPQGSPMAGVGNENVITSLSNCFVIGSNNDADSYGGIIRVDEEQIQLMKRRGGVGHDLSHLRPNGSFANNSILSGLAGTVAYAERYSNSTKEVSQGGRRGALMLTIDCRHPDTELFIDSKMESGKITGANISVKINDEFIDCVKRDDDFYQTFPIDLKIPLGNGIDDIIRNLQYDKLTPVSGGYIKKVKAKRIWDKIIKNAHNSAEPGILFWDRVTKESPADLYGNSWKTISTNPCLTGDTVVAVADGRNGVTIKELSDSGEDVLVYSGRPKRGIAKNVGWKAEIKNAKPFWTGVKPVICVKLSDGSDLKCTHDHLLALDDYSYIEASKSLGMKLSKFYSFSDKNTGKSYRHINSVYNGFSRQYYMIWNYFNGDYDGRKFNIDHIDNNSTNDSYDNLELITVDEHKIRTKRFGSDNPIHKISGTPYLRLYSQRSNINANGAKYNWSNEKIESKLREWDEKHGDDLLKSKPKDKNIILDNDVFVVGIEELGYQDVYDLNVEDNHNFYIITKTDDDKFLNSSGVLVHNCGELPLPEYDSCRLLLINLYSYVENPFTPYSKFNFELFAEHVIVAQRLMDDLVDLEIEKIDRIINKVKSDPEPDDIKAVELNLWKKIRKKAVDGRRTGLGVTAEGDMLAALGFTYGSLGSIGMSEKVHKHLAVNSYRSSIRMAEERGSFPICDPKLELADHPFLQRIYSSLGTDDLVVWNRYGRRNIANLTIAPAGSVSIETQTTSGIEPTFLVYYNRRRRTEDPSKASFTDEQGEMFEEFKVFHHGFIKWFQINHWDKVDDHLGVNSPKEWLEKCSDSVIDEYIKSSPYYKATSADIDWVSKVELQGRVQRWVDHSISATTNIPEKTPVSVVSDIYMKAYESGCKGMTIYREGSRSGILVQQKKDEFEYIDALKRPKELVCDIYRKTALKRDWMVVVGKIGDKPYEIFAFPDLENQVFPSRISEGKVIKVKSGVYKLVAEDSGKVYELNNIIKHIDISDQVDTRKYSIMLRHRIDPRWIVDSIEAYAIITSFDKVVQRVLRNYIEEDSSVCEICGGEMRHDSGCSTCVDCGYSKCN